VTGRYASSPLAPPGAGAAIRTAACLLALIFFQVGYKWGYRYHEGPGVISGVTPLDQWLPLVPQFIVFYMLGYLFVFAPCFVVRGRHSFQAAFVVFCAMLAVAFVTFRFFPVAMPKVYATDADWFSRVAYFQQSQDTPYNTIPSLHVAANVYAYALIGWQYPGLNRAWIAVPVLIIASTLLVKQHLLVDVLTGMLLAGAGYYAFRRLIRAPERVTNGLFALTAAGLVLVLLTHLERLGKTWRKLERFLQSGGLAPADLLWPLVVLAAIALLWRLSVTRRNREHREERQGQQVQRRKQPEQRHAEGDEPR